MKKKFIQIMSNKLLLVRHSIIKFYHKAFVVKKKPLYISFIYTTNRLIYMVISVKKGDCPVIKLNTISIYLMNN